MVNWIYFALIAAIGYGVQNILFRFVMDKGVPPTLVTAIVFSLSTITIWSFLYFSEKIVLPSQNIIILILLIGSIIAGFANISAFKAMAAAPNAGYAYAISSVGILITTFLSFFVFNLKFDITGIIGVVLIFSGLLFLSGVIKV